MPARSMLHSRFSPSFQTALVLALLLTPALASAKTFVLPHVLESSGVIHSSTDATTFGALDVELSSLTLTTSSDSAVCVPCTLPIGASATAPYTFDTTFFFTYSPSSGGTPQQASFFDVFVDLELTNSSVAGDPVRVFDTEMLSLSLTLPGPFQIRESPTRASHGRYSAQPLPGGGYEVDSFFDIFTELSIDGGQTWTPADAPLHLTLTEVPEPSTALLAAFGLLGLGIYRRR